MTTVTIFQTGRLGSTSNRLGTIHAVGASSSSLGVGGRAHHGPGMTREPLHHARSTRLAANPATQIPFEHIEQYSRFKSTLSHSASQRETSNLPLRLPPSTLPPRAENSISASKNISTTRSAPALAAVGMVTTPSTTGSRRLSLTLARTGTRHSGRRPSSASSHRTTHSWHGTSGIMANLPTPGMLASLAGAAHYTGNPKYSKQEAIRASFGSKQVVLEDQRKQTVEDVLELFCAHPSLEIFDRSWNPDAVYEDPWTKCVGYKEYTAQWFSLPRVTSQSTTVQYRVLSSTHHPHRIVLDQTQQYTLRYIKRKKTIHSLVFLELDEQGKIIKMEDRWNGEEPPRKWGALWLRRLNGKTAPLFVRVPRPSLERTPTPV